VTSRADDVRRIVDAAAFAADRHRHQRRKDVDATPYINHPLQLAHVLMAEGGVEEVDTIIAAILHDTIEDTKTTADEIEARFGKEVATVVLEVTDDKKLSKARRKELQVEHAPHLSQRARAVKLADKICNLRDVAASPPAGWELARKQEYFDWAKRVVDGLRGSYPKLEQAFDEAYARRP
jgi:GTP diphosphokinase / guanosine-3',5'-bis(diphosphate) 3'-diphosphatase